jgi:hypothetical protein
MKVAIRPRSHVLRRGAVLAAVGALLVPLGFIGGTSAGAADRAGALEMYTATVTRAQVAELVRDGYDVTASRSTTSGVAVDLVLADSEVTTLRGKGVDVTVKRNKDGKSARQLAAEQAQGGYVVWRSFDEPGGIRDQMYDIAQKNPKIAKLEVIGRSVQGREILALKITRDANTLADGSRPAVMYAATQHAREWISTEVNRRLLRYFVDGYKTNATVKDLVDTREMWFVLVANPDGYQYTFDAERLWRKNLRDNNGDGLITVGDGIDPNRNFDEHWNYDNEGSSSELPSDTYRGPSAASEPETRAYQGLLQRLRPKFLVNYHSYGQLLLYSFGWQVQTPSTDDPIFVALSGTDADPAIEGFNPGVGADLYTTNGETTDYAHVKTNTLAWTPELSEGIPGNGFVFPDDPQLVAHEFAINLPFALDVAKSAPDPANPLSHLGNTVAPFYVDDFAVSYGDPQTVAVTAKRSIGAVTLWWQVNGGAAKSAATQEWSGGERYGGPGDVYYRELRGQVTGTAPGDSVKVWFTGGGQTSDSFTYQVRSDSGRRVLVLAAEDYSGISPAYKKTSGPSYLSYYLDALAANNVAADVYDVDANGRRAPHSLGVLDHYDAVVWYTGDDVITRDRGMVPGTASKLANDLMLEVRDYLNDGGHLLYTGKYAGYQFAFGYEYDPVSGAACDPDSDADGCVALPDDFLQYYLGAYLYNDDAGTNAKGHLYDVVGTDTPFEGLAWGFGGPSANNQDHSASFIATSGILPAVQYPQFESWASAKYVRPGGPFEPHTGSYYAYSQIADVSYKRLTRTVDLTGASSGNVGFWVSHDTEPAWDHLVVEAHTVGQDDWTTLPDANGHTTQATGDSCPEGWRDLHPFLDHYQTLQVDGTCTSTGTTGTWNAASGSSGGWQQWSVDLSAYAGKQVEISIGYISDWSVQGLGVFVDDTTISTGASTSFESDLGGWSVSGPPPGSGPNANNFIRSTSDGFPEGAAITTPDTVYLGFGLEGVATVASRNAIMGAAVDHLLP